MTVDLARWVTQGSRCFICCCSVQCYTDGTFASRRVYNGFIVIFAIFKRFVSCQRFDIKFCGSLIFLSNVLKWTLIILMTIVIILMVLCFLYCFIMVQMVSLWSIFAFIKFYASLIFLSYVLKCLWKIIRMNVGLWSIFSLLGKFWSCQRLHQKFMNVKSPESCYNMSKGTVAYML